MCGAKRKSQSILERDGGAKRRGKKAFIPKCRKVMGKGGEGIELGGNLSSLNEERGLGKGVVPDQG